MSIQNLFLLAAGIINLLMSILVFSRGVKNNKINLYFSLLTFFSFLWSIGVLLARVLVGPWWLFWAQLNYPVALAIALSFFYFSVYFPYITKKYGKTINILFLAIFSFFFIIVFRVGLFIIGFNKDPMFTDYTLYLNKMSYILYAIFFIVVVLISLYNLFIKYLSAEGVLRQRIKAFLIAILVAFLLGSYFDLILPYFANFRYVWLGPIFTFLINYVVFRFIYNKTA